jgi:uncharacterized protein YsxB (DUF464 family)
MVKIRVWRNGGHISAFGVEGHANAARAGEYDLVCAAVSVLAQNAMLSSEELLHLERSFESSNGHLSYHRPAVPEDKKPGLDLLLESMLVGLRQLERQYPQYVSIEQHENEEVEE